MENTVYAVTYRWLDLAGDGGKVYAEYYETELEARMAADKLACDQRNSYAVFPDGRGQLEVTISEFKLVGQLSTVRT